MVRAAQVPPTSGRLALYLTKPRQEVKQLSVGNRETQTARLARPPFSFCRKGGTQNHFAQAEAFEGCIVGQARPPWIGRLNCELAVSAVRVPLA